MPSIQDVADQINTRLEQIMTHTAATAQNTTDNLAVSQDIHNKIVEVNNRLSMINTTLSAGFANLSQGIFALINVQLAALNLLDHNRKQNDTIICELVNNNQLLCNIKRKFAKQLRFSEESLVSTKRIEGIMDRVHCSEAGSYDREYDLNRKIEECCPPEPIPLEECPDVCSRPKYREHKLPDLDWRPLETPNEPIG